MSRNEKTFAEIVAEALAEERPVGVPMVRPGSFNAEGEFFDPEGHLLNRVGEVTPKEARAYVASGAMLAFEGCGCGGWAGCQAEWIEEAVRAELGAMKPRFVKGYGSPTWIDLWRSEVGLVVFAHGDVEWGEALL